MGAISPGLAIWLSFRSITGSTCSVILSWTTRMSASPTQAMRACSISWRPCAGYAATWQRLAAIPIFGQSGGGAKVSALMATPAARGLYHKVIAQSCSGSLRHAGQEEAAAMANGLAGKLGLTRVSGEALQAISMDRL